MAQIAFLLLCHKDPEGVIAQARRLTEAGDCVAIHFDRRAGRAAYRQIRAALDRTPGIAFTPRRLRCGWGSWSLVRAALMTAQTALDRFPEASHFYLVSGDCLPIKTAEYTRRRLEDDNADIIESVDFFNSGWIRTGLQDERLTYRHLFNERSQRRLFYASLAIQRALGLSRRSPADLTVMIGSQWWCLRRDTMARVLEVTRRRRDLVRFFRTSWIPDETYIQTLVRSLVPASEIRSRAPTFLIFTDYGVPVTFYNDHYDLLLGQDAFFARKISPEATELRSRLGALYARRDVTFDISDEGRTLHAFLTGRGRVGRRFAPRAWDPEAVLNRDRQLMIVICKKWHVAKRLIDGIQRATNIPTLAYLFNEEATPLPDLGGIGTTLDKRLRNKRAFLGLLFSHFDTDRMVMCVDPANFDLVAELAQEHPATRLLQVECRFSDAYLAGHARRVGLVGPGGNAVPLLPAIRGDLRDEQARLQDAGFATLGRLSETDPPDQAAGALAAFLDIDRGAAAEIAQMEHLFSD